MNYQIETIEKKQMAEIYRTWLVKHFPSDEVKPLKKIEELWDQGNYRAVGIYNIEGEKKLAGYACLVFSTDSKWVLLDYYAILEEYRNAGIGGRFLQKLKEVIKDYHGILIETEDIDFANTEEEKSEREKRDRFYAGNGVKKTGVKSEVYGVHYAIWQFPVGETLSDEACENALDNIYRVFLPKDKAAIDRKQ